MKLKNISIIMRTKIDSYIKTWEDRCYHNGIPDEAPVEIFDMVPSYKRIAIAILKNDLSDIGINGKKSEYYGILKRIEINKRNEKLQNQSNRSKD
jgi:predicted phosphoadenosine phosphosulfate sulfurtransferase